ncbi:MAG: ATP-binding protein, partial [Thermoprotei archaeon]
MERALDPREAAIDKRFKGIKYSVLVLSGKGGVGKSVISSIISLLLAKEKF